MLAVKRGASRRAGEAAAAADLAAQIGDPDAACALVFAAPTYDPAALAAALAQAFAPVPVYGCTTAGEIGAGGFASGSVVGMTLRSARLRVAAGCSGALAGTALSGGRQATWAAAAGLGRSLDQLTPNRHVAITLIDGRSGHEESFIAGAAASAPGIAFVGGSAADDYGDTKAKLFIDGRARSDCGLVLLFETDHPFKVIMSEHMVPSGGRVVVTATEPGSRLITELNGLPAAREYARLIGAEPGSVDVALASRFPFGYYVGGRAYVRSVMGVEGDGLRFACAVDRGSVLVPMQAGQMIATTERALADAQVEVGGDMKALVAFNCLGRYFESEAAGITGQVGALLDRFPVVGFNTFGEQFHALHVNHTFTALALGSGRSG